MYTETDGNVISFIGILSLTKVFYTKFVLWWWWGWMKSEWKVIILRGTWMSVQNLKAIHAMVLKSFNLKPQMST